MQVSLDHGLLRHLVGETRRELNATLERNLLRLWQQQKLVVRECELERFERSFQHLIAGSRSFNRTAAKLASRANASMRKQLLASRPLNINAWSSLPNSWAYENDLEEFKLAVIASINVRRRQAGLDDLTSFWTDGDDTVVRPGTRRWCTRLAFRALLLYAQVCQSSFAYRKAINIPLPPFPSTPWLAAVLLPWRFQPGKMPEGAPVQARATEADAEADAAQDGMPASQASAGDAKAGQDGQDHGIMAESPKLPASPSDTAAGLQVMSNSPASTVQDVFISAGSTVQDVFNSGQKQVFKVVNSVQSAVSSLLSAKPPQDLEPEGDNLK
jgi:hypothetical protein